MNRLQGEIWYRKKPKMKFINYSKTDKDNYRALVEDNNGKKYIHFLSEQEKLTFKEVEEKYKDKLVTFEEQNRILNKKK